ncbi:type III polyketide synthase [soil metagenome]
MSSSSYIHDFKIVLPRHRINQDFLTTWIAKCHQHADSMKPTAERMEPELLAKLFARYAVKATQISERHFDCNDVEISDYSRNEIFRIDPEHPAGVDIEARTRFFEKRADEVFHEFYDVTKSIDRPDHLIHVTCTGYVSPSAAQKIVTHENWNHPTAITHAYHMGCYASLPAVRLATALSKSVARVDIAHNEMCGLHMNPTLQTPEQFVVQTLFADGHVKYSVSETKKVKGRSLRVKAILERVVPDSKDDMTWLPTAMGLQMTLSREIPAKVKQVLPRFARDLFDQAEMSFESARKSVFAIHPGGPKIIDSVQEALELDVNQIRESRKILFERGNMSSATLPHVWNEIIDGTSNDGVYDPGTHVVSFAFGPGLTLFGAVFEIC